MPRPSRWWSRQGCPHSTHPPRCSSTSFWRRVVAGMTSTVPPSWCPCQPPGTVDFLCICEGVSHKYNAPMPGDAPDVVVNNGEEGSDVLATAAVASAAVSGAAAATASDAAQTADEASARADAAQDTASAALSAAATRPDEAETRRIAREEAKAEMSEGMAALATYLETNREPAAPAAPTPTSAEPPKPDKPPTNLERRAGVKKKHWWENYAAGSSRR